VRVCATLSVHDCEYECTNVCANADECDNCVSAVCISECERGCVRVCVNEFLSMIVC
jgi:hypothetical protein